MRYIYLNVVQDDGGSPVENANITVYLAGGTTKATIYTALSGGSPDADSIVQSDSSGAFYFYVDEDDYSHNQRFKIAISKTAYTGETWDYIQIFPDADRTLITSSTADQGDSSIVGTLAWHISDVSGANTIVRVLDGTHIISQNITVPATMTLDFDQGGILADDSNNADLTINGLIKAQRQQIFDWGNGSGTLSIDNTVLNYIYPEWWGENSTPGTTDMSSQIQAAIDIIVANSRVPIVLAPGETYYTSSTTLTLPVNGITVRGCGATILYAGTDTALKTGTAGSTRYDMTFCDIIFETNVAAGSLNTLVDLRGISRLRMQRCRAKTNGNDALWLGTSAAGDGSMHIVIDQSEFNMEINGNGNGIYVDNNIMTALAVRDCKFSYGDNQILLADTAGSCAATVVDHCSFESGDICINVNTDGVKELIISNSFAESYDEAFLKSASPYTSINNRQSSPGNLIYDIQMYDPKIKMIEPDAYSGGTIPIPNFPGSNQSRNSDFAEWTGTTPDGYIQSGGSVTWSQESTIVLIGESSLKAVTTATGQILKQRVSAAGQLASLKGRRVYFCVWIYAADANNVRLIIDDSVGTADSISPLYHPGDSAWHYLVATKIIDSSATFVDFIVKNYVASSTYYIDSFTWSVGEPVSLYAVTSNVDSISY